MIGSGKRPSSRTPATEMARAKAVSGRAIDRRRIGLRLAHVHVDDHAQVVERRQRRVQRDRHRQPGDARVDRRDQHVQLGEEADRGRDAGQGEEQDAIAAARAGARPARPAKAARARRSGAGRAAACPTTLKAAMFITP